MWAFVSFGIWGLVSDKYGRRIVTCLGYLHIAVAFALIPLGKNIYPQFFLIRILLSQGTSAIAVMLTALLADYVKYESLGRAAGFMGLASGTGALVAVFVSYRINGRISV